MKRKRWSAKPPIDFSKVDWTLPVKAIAHELGCTEVHVYKHRPAHIPKYQRAFDFSDVDWSKTNAQIAKEKGCSAPLVGMSRPQLAADLRDYSWATMSNAEIAHKAGVGIWTVRKWRVRYHLPECKRWWDRIDPDLTVQENSIKLRKPRSAIYWAVKTKGRKTRKLKTGRPKKHRATWQEIKQDKLTDATPITKALFEDFRPPWRIGLKQMTTLIHAFHRMETELNKKFANVT